MEEAQERLRQVEERTKAAERRAAEAERLAQLKAEEEERQQRLREMQESVAQAEERAREAERRAAEAEQAVIRSVEGGGEALQPAAYPSPLSAPHLRRHHRPISFLHPRCRPSRP